MNLEGKIKEIANNHLADESHFVVDVNISTRKGPSKVLVLLDGDKGVNIDDCANLSRAISAELEENETMESAYTLEVSSPGVDYPLTLGRQFQKNIGRDVKVTLEDGKDIKGELKAYNDQTITLKKVKGKGKKKEIEEIEIPLQDIKKTIVQISFK